MLGSGINLFLEYDSSSNHKQNFEETARRDGGGVGDDETV